MTFDINKEAFAGVIRNLFWALEWAERGQRFTAGINIGRAQSWYSDFTNEEIRAKARALTDKVWHVAEKGRAKSFAKAKDAILSVAAENGVHVEFDKYGVSKVEVLHVD